MIPPSPGTDLTEGARGASSWRVGALVVGALVVGATVAYVAAAPRHVLGGDNGEFATLFATGGVAHPTGYPLYVLWLRAFRWLPAASPAHGAALATAILGGATTLLLYAACRAWSASRGASAVVVAAYAFSAHAWIASSHAEVFALNTLLAAAILFFVATDRVRGLGRVVALGLLAGLGLSNHVSIVLLTPVGLYGAVRGVREAPRKALAVLAGLLALFLGFAPYAYVMWAARTPAEHVVWGEAHTLRGLLRHVLREEYGTTTLTTGANRADRVGQLLLLSRTLLVDLLGLPLFALAGAFLGRRSSRAGETSGVGERRGRLALLAAFALAGPGFVLLFNLSVSGLDRLIVERFHLLPLLVACVWIAPALDGLAGRWLARGRLVTGAAVAVAVTSAALSLEDVRAHHAPHVERYVRDTLAIAPPGAVLLGTGDHRFGAFLYAERALGLRPDVVYLDVQLALNGWYRARIGQRLGLVLVAPHGTTLSTTELATQLLATGRPVFLTNTFTEAIPRTFSVYPIGTLLRVVRTPAELPDPATLEAANVEAFARMSEPLPPPYEGTWGGDLQPAYAHPWSVLAAVYRRQGDLAHAERLQARASSRMPLRP